MGSTTWPLDWMSKRLLSVWENLHRNHLWQRMLRNTIATSLTIGISLIRYNSAPPFGKAAYLAAMVSVFAHPGRRVGQLIEALTLALAGGFIGIGYSLLGLYLSSLLMDSNQEAAYAIRGIFLAVALMFHGFYRSHTPRMFLLVLLFIIEAITALVTTTKYVSTQLVKQLVYPILLAGAVILLVNLCVFPEFSSDFLGKTTIDALDTVSDALTRAGHHFIEYSDTSSATEKATGQGIVGRTPPKHKHQNEDTVAVRLADVTAMKSRVRQALSSCRNAQNESQFEVAYSHIPPHFLSPISKKAMKRLVTHTVAVIGACETRFALLGDVSATKGEKAKSKGHDARLKGRVDLQTLKPQREIEYGNVKLLRYLLSKIRDPYLNFQASVSRSLTVIIVCLAYAYDVPRLPSGTRTPKGIARAELDIHYQELQSAIERLDADTTVALEGAVTLQDLGKEDFDIMPREEIFLVASFLLNARQAAVQICEMLRLTKEVIIARSDHTGPRKIYLPRIQWRKWLYSGGEEDESLPASQRQGNLDRKAMRNKTQEDDDISSATNLLRQGRSKEDRDLENIHSEPRPVTSSPSDNQLSGADVPVISEANFLARTRGSLADVLEWAQHSEDLSYAFKLTIAAYMVTFPAMVPSLNAFYGRYRGTWAALQLIFVFDVAIGTSINNFILRAIGTTLGSLWGWAAYEAGNGNPFLCTAMLFIGLVPSTYVQLGTAFPKAGMVTIVSMSVVALATELQTVPGSGTENFLNRWLAFLVGGVVALIVEMVLLPVKARSRMVDALAAAIRKISRMEEYIAYGIEEGSLNEGFPPAVFKGFERASNKAKSSLGSAETFLPFCTVEPRLKGSFREMSNVYKEIIFVLRQIVDKMDNMLQLRISYGSGPLEEFNTLILSYRRNVAGAITAILYAIHEALTTKYPLPQFLPSARLAHLRIINRIRDTVHNTVRRESTSNKEIAKIVRQRTLRQKYMSWNASSAAQAEIIEYLEELTDLTKLLVGSSEFRTGLLTRPTFQRYAAHPSGGFDDELKPLDHGEEGKDDAVPSIQPFRSPERRTEESAEIPVSLQRIHSRKQEAGLKKRRGNVESEKDA